MASHSSKNKMASLILDSLKMNLKFSPADMEPREGKLIRRIWVNNNNKNKIYMANKKTFTVTVTADIRTYIRTTHAELLQPQCQHKANSIRNFQSIEPITCKYSICTIDANTKHEGYVRGRLYLACTYCVRKM